MLPISQLSGIISQSGTQVVIAPGTPVTTLQVRATGAGTFPYSATVLPLEGQVPTGSTLQCVEDTSLRACILSTHSDGSASVVVVSGTTTVSLNQTKTLSLQTATIVGETNLNASRISSLLTDISLNFGSPYGTATISDFSSPERIWWATPTTICARYRIQPPTLSGTQLEAVIDVHAYASSTNALVEIVVENCKMNTASPSAPSAASYTSAVLTINGNTITTVNGNGAPEGYHAPFRSWYSSSWLQGDPGLRITQLYTDLQKHPLLYKMDQASTVDMAGYAGDAYSPWATGRQRAYDMGGGGDHDSIGPLPKWEAQFLQTGDYRVANAVEVSALAILGYNINYRDSTTGLVPTFDQLNINNVSITGYPSNDPHHWPSQSNNADHMDWEVAHHPAAGLMAFVSRPSPIFIEIAQKISVWNGAWAISGENAPRRTGVFGYSYQIRGRAWCMRSLGHATFLTPDGQAWKTAAKISISDNVAHLTRWVLDSKAVLNAMWDSTPEVIDGYNIGYVTGGSNYAQATGLWQYHYLISELHKVESTKLLTGSAQTAFTVLADWCALQPVRFINEQSNGAWRYIPYATPMGRNATTMDSLPDWGQQMDWWYDDSPPALSGGWYWVDLAAHVYAGAALDTVAGALYPSYFYAALVSAVERRVTGYAQAWTSLQNNLVGLSSWASGFGSDPRWGSTPRISVPVVPVSGFASGSGTGSYNSGTRTWSPARTSGVVNQASWDIVPISTWVSVASTNIDGLTSQITSAVPGWDYSSLLWRRGMAAWNGFALDTANSRVWLVSAGGHGDSPNNGIYRFDLFKMNWAVEQMPSDRSLWSNTYKNYGNVGGSWTGCPESQAVFDAQVSTGAYGGPDERNNWFGDEIYWDEPRAPAFGATPSGRPTSRHQYSSSVYLPSTNELVMLNRRWWRYSIDLGYWTEKHIYVPGVDGAQQCGIYDELTNEYLFGAAGSDSKYATLGVDLATNEWTSWSSPWGLYPVADARHGRQITMFAAPSSDSGNGRYWLYDLGSIAGNRSLTYNNVVPQLSGLTLSEFKQFNETEGGAQWGMCYIPSLNRYWMVGPMQSGLRFIQLDPTTTPWTVSPLIFPNGNPQVAGDITVVCRKFVYMPGLDAVLFMDAADLPLFIYKLS